MLKLKPEYITKNGRKQFVVLSVEDFDRLVEALEDAEDLRILREARRRNANSPSYTLDEVKRQLGLGRPRRTKARRNAKAA